MVNSVSSNPMYSTMYSTARVATQAAGRYSNDIENMVKYINGQPLSSQDDMPISTIISSNIPFLGAFGAYSMYTSLKNNGLSGQALENAKKAAERAGKKFTGWDINKTITNIKAATPIKARSQYLEAATQGVADKFKDVFKKSVPVSNEGRWKIFKFMDKIPGYAKLRQSGFGQMMGKTGAGSWAVFGGAIELLTQVVPAFQQGGAEAGFKQLGKSAVKVAADTAGFVAGDIVCRGLGAAIGTLICPGIGTTIGGYIGGFLGGMVGSAIAGKVVKNVVGPSEVEKIQQEQTSQVAQQIEADPNAKLQLAQQTLQQAQSVLEQDPENADALAAKASAENTIAQLTQSAGNVDYQTQDATQVQNQPQVQQTASGTQQPMMAGGIPVVPGFNGYGYDMNIFKQSMQNVSAVPNPTTYTNNLFNQNMFNANLMYPSMTQQTVA